MATAREEEEEKMKREIQELKEWRTGLDRNQTQTSIRTEDENRKDERRKQEEKKDNWTRKNLE